MRKNLTAMRKQQNLTQEETAKLLNITTRHYRSLEKGNSNGSIKLWLNIAKLFKKDISFLLQQETDSMQNT